MAGIRHVRGVSLGSEGWAEGARMPGQKHGARFLASLPERRGSGANVRKERIHLMVWYGRIVAAAAAAAHHWHRLRRGNGGRTN